MIVEKLRKLRADWEEYGLFLLAIASIIFILIYAILRVGKKGSYDENRYAIITPKTTALSHKQHHHKKDSTGETICRSYLENRFGCSFDKARPDFLKNPVMGGYNLELDCFNPRLRIAVEYNGAQHYKFIPYFHRNKEAFANQKYRDEMKRVKCRENGIILIEVPYTISHDKIPSYLDSELLKFGF